jgi:hypothetical protein
MNADPLPTPSDLDAILAIKDLDSFSKFIAQKLNAAKEPLAAYQGGASAALQQALVDDFNSITVSLPLYRAPYFSSIKSSVVAGLIKQLIQAFPNGFDPKKLSPTDSTLVAMQKLNRWLLASAFPDEMASWVVTLTGANFSPDSIVLVAGKPLVGDEGPRFVNTETLELKLKVANHDPEDVQVVVCNPSSTGACSATESISLD